MTLRVLDPAENELRDAIRYYEARRAGLGREFHDAVAATMSAIEREPFRFPLYEGVRLQRPYRRAPVPRFPYIIVFEPREGESLVVAVAHTSRWPGYWRRRR